MEVRPLAGRCPALSPEEPPSAGRCAVLFPGERPSAGRCPALSRKSVRRPVGAPHFLRENAMEDDRRASNGGRTLWRARDARRTAGERSGERAGRVERGENAVASVRGALKPAIRAAGDDKGPAFSSLAAPCSRCRRPSKRKISAARAVFSARSPPCGGGPWRASVGRRDDVTMTIRRSARRDDVTT